MQFNREIDPFSHSISAYGPGEVTVVLPFQSVAPDDGRRASPSRHETLHCSIIITPGTLIRDWPPQTFEELQHRHFQTLVDLQPEIVLFGSGSRLRWPAAGLTAPLLSRGIGIEVMDTAAACRTYNILMADERKVAAALLMI